MDNNLVKILATKIHTANFINQSYFAYINQFDVKESKTSAKTIQGFNTPYWIQTMTKKLDQFYKNNN